MTTPSSSGAPDPMLPSTQGVRALATLCQRAGVTELEAGDGARFVRLRLDPTSAAAVSPIMPDPAETAAMGPYLLPSEWVGIFHRAAEGEVEPFAREGIVLKEGQVLAVVAAMQMQHEVRADRAGILQRFLIEDGAPVEYGQPLLEVE